MTKWSKISLLLSGLSIVVMVASRTILGGWVDFLYIPLATFILGLILAMIFDFKTLVDFFTMRTTKHGMNMGAMILLTLGLLVSLNYLGVRFNKTVDLTEEGLNSLSDQSQQVLDKLDEDLNVIVFYRGEEAKPQRQAIRQNLTLYQEASNKFKVRFSNPYVDVALAQQYLNELPDRNQGEVFVFVDYKGKKVRVDLEGPGQLSEEQMTAAIIRATRPGVKSIYFLSGHGERDISGDQSESLSQLVEALEGASYKVDQLNLTQTPQIPDDATVLAIVGSTSPLLEGELDLIREFVRSGGRLFVAADPGQRHNLALLTKSFGVEFKNTFIFNQLSQIVGRGMASAIGLIYDPTSEITKKLRTGEMTVFDLASEVVPALDAPPGLNLTPLVKTHETAYSVADVSQAQRPRGEDMREHTLGVLSEGQAQVSPDGAEGQDFAMVVYGDSDFLANKSFFQGLNRDLALNSFAYLAQEDDLISIRPKQPRGTEMMMTQYSQLGMVGAGISLPMFLLILSGVLWFRRRGA